MVFRGLMIIALACALSPLSSHAWLQVGSATQSVNPAVSSTGRYVVFESDTLGEGHQIYKRDTQTQSLTLVSSDSNGNRGSGGSFHPQISGDGRFVTFESNSAFFPNSAHQQIYFKDTLTGALSFISAPMVPVPVTHDGPGIHNFPVVRSDGKRVYFQSNSPYFMPGGDVVYRIYEKNTETGEVRIVSTASDGTLANSASMMPSLDPSGRFLFFESTASNLVSGARGYQIFRKDLTTGELIRVSTNEQGVSADGSCGGASAALGGVLVAFTCQASNFIAGETGAQTYLKDLQSGKLIWIDRGMSFPVLNAAGTAVTWLNSLGEIHHLNLSTHELRTLSVSQPLQFFQKISISADDSTLVFSAFSLNDSRGVSVWSASLASDFHL